MNCCTTSNSYLWILTGWPMLIAALYVLSKNGTLASFFNSLGGCNN